MITSSEEVWAKLERMLQAQNGQYIGVLNPAEGSITFTSGKGQPITYWLAQQGSEDYLTSDIEFGDVRIILSVEETIEGPKMVTIGHWGGDLFTLNGLNFEGRVFRPFKFHP